MTVLTNVGAAILLFAAPQVASAYLDPGTGSLILQGLLAAVAGIMVAGRVYWYKLKSFFVPAPPMSLSDDVAEHGDESVAGHDTEEHASERRG